MLVSHSLVCTLLLYGLQEGKTTSGAGTSHDARTEDPKKLASNENDSDDDRLQERVLKAIADRERSSRGHVEGGEGTALVSHEEALVYAEVHREESSQDAMGPSSTNVVANIGTQVLRPRYVLLLEIDGFLMW